MDALLGGWNAAFVYLCWVSCWEQCIIDISIERHMHFHEINLSYFSIEIKWLPITSIITHYPVILTLITALILSSVCLQPSFMISTVVVARFIWFLQACLLGSIFLAGLGLCQELDQTGGKQNIVYIRNTFHHTLFSTMSTDNEKHNTWSFRVKEWSQHDKRKTGEFLVSRLLIYLKEILEGPINHFFIV